jgi:large subunit ribosomal protein L3
MAVKGILGKKIGMTQVFAEDGKVIPVTVLKAGPCVVVQRKTTETDGYDAVQIGLVEFVKPQRINKPLTGHFKKSGAPPVKLLREIHLADAKEEAKAGDKVLVEEIFKPEDRVDVVGVSKGRGFAGVMMGNKRSTARNLQVVRVDSDEHLLLVRGAVPGARGGYVMIQKTTKVAPRKKG